MTPSEPIARRAAGNAAPPRAEVDPARALRIALVVTLVGLVPALAQWRQLDLPTAHIFLHQFVVFELSGGLVTLALLLIAAWLLPRVDPGRCERAAALLGRHPGKAAAATVVALAAGALVVYHDHPLSMDEFLPWFHARAFAAGRLTGEWPTPLLPWLIPPPFLGLFFDVSTVTGRVVATHWPGFALLLTPFTWLGVPWLANPVIAGVGVLLLAYVARRTLGDEAAVGWSLALALASPAFVVNGFSYYSMNSHLVANLAYTALLLEARAHRLFAAGVVGSLALVLNQPLPHFLFALPWIAWLAWRPGRLKHLGCLAAGYLPLSLLLGFGWLQLRASVRHEGIAAAADAVAQPLVAQAAHMVTSMLHLPTLQILSFRLMGYVKVWNWAVPALPLLAWLGYRACRDRPALGRIFASAALTIVGYWFTPPMNTQGHGWGFRYFHSAWWVLPLFAAALVVGDHARRARWTALLGVLTMLALLVTLPLHLVQVERFVARHLAQDFPVAGSGTQIHLLRLDRGYYTQDLIQNDPFLRGPAIRLRSLGAERDHEMLRRAFPGARLERADERGELWRVPPRSPAGP